MAWSYSQPTAGTTISSSTGYYSGTQSLNPGELAYITVESSFADTASPLTVSAYGCDTNTTSYNKVADVSFEISTGDDPNKVGFIISGLPYFVIGATMAGTGEIQVMVNLAKDGVSL